jgi:hypothetical protein
MRWTLYLLYCDGIREKIVQEGTTNREHFQQIFFRRDESLEWLLVLDGARSDSLEGCIFGLGDGSGYNISGTECQ